MHCIAKSHWAQDLMKHIELHQTITDDQYGGRARRQAQSAVLNKITYFDLQHQLAGPAVFIDKDARNCFDRIIPNLITMENETLGSPTNVERKYNFKSSANNPQLHQQPFRKPYPIVVNKKHA